MVVGGVMFVGEVFMLIM